MFPINRSSLLIQIPPTTSSCEIYHTNQLLFRDLLLSRFMNTSPGTFPTHFEVERASTKPLQLRLLRLFWPFLNSHRRWWSVPYRNQIWVSSPYSGSPEPGWPNSSHIHQLIRIYLRHSWRATAWKLRTPIHLYWTCTTTHFNTKSYQITLIPGLVRFWYAKIPLGPPLWKCYLNQWMTNLEIRPTKDCFLPVR